MKRLLCALLLAGCGGADPVVPDGGTTPDASTTPDAGSTLDAGQALSEVCPVTQFTACGGDVQGSWRIRSFCPEDQATADALYEHPFDDRPQCQRPDNPVNAVRTLTGTITFAGTTMTMATTTKTSLSYGFTDACLAVAFRNITDPMQACSELENNGRLSCTYAANLCTCQGTLPQASDVEDAEFEISGNQLTLGGRQTADYCIDGQRLTFDWAQHPISWRYWIMDRL